MYYSQQSRWTKVDSTSSGKKRQIRSRDINTKHLEKKNYTLSTDKNRYIYLQKNKQKEQKER